MDISIRVQYEGVLYEGKCSISQIKFQTNVRGVLCFNNAMLQEVGIFPENRPDLLKNKAEAILLEHIIEEKKKGNI
ncbi:MAG TPA: hypothetical protein DDY22_07515 [Geobacter sp.]|nr:hypothetical protein [Geobacter sp.]